MRTRSTRPGGLTFLNARMIDGGTHSLRIVGKRIAGVDLEPRAGDSIVDLQGDRVLPGLINAHDHLQLNSLARDASRKRYRHVRDWISEIGEDRLSNPAFRASIAVPRDERLLIGGMKNLLSGVTTVAHHDKLYPFLTRSNYPIRVVQHYGWSHSLYADGETAVADSYRQTRADLPWMIHAAEGLDEAAAHEFDRLDSLGCIGPNTLVVHGIALNRARRRRLEQAGAGLIWCPSSNLNLFGKTAEAAELASKGQAALGTDSRLSGARDLLEELRVAADVGGLDDAALESLVTSNGARLLRLADHGTLRAAARADLLILPAGTALAGAYRASVRLVMIDGAVRYGDEQCARCVEPGSQWAEIRVDGRPKVLDRSLAELLSRSSVGEIGLELPHTAGRAA